MSQIFLLWNLRKYVVLFIKEFDNFPAMLNTWGGGLEGESISINLAVFSVSLKTQQKKTSSKKSAKKFCLQKNNFFSYFLKHFH